MQTTTQNIHVLDRLLDPVREVLTPEVAEGLANLRASAADQARLEYLAEKNTAGQLTPDEQGEYRSFVEVGNLIAVLQTKARAVVQSRRTS
jgi:hypothetical protein